MPSLVGSEMCIRDSSIECGIGTPSFWAPEIDKEDGKVKASALACDLYALGSAINPLIEKGELVSTETKDFIRDLMSDVPEKRIEGMWKILSKKREVNITKTEQEKLLERRNKAQKKQPEDLIQLSEMYARVYNGDKALQVLGQIDVGQLSEDQLRVKYWKAKGEASITSANYVDALKSFQEALNIVRSLSEKTSGFEGLDVAPYYSGLGRAYELNADFEKAIQAHYQAIELNTKYLSAEDASVGLSYTNIGLVYKEMEEFEKALEFFTKGMEIITKRYSSDSLEASCSYANLSYVLYRLNKYEESIKYGERAMDIRSVRLSPSHPDVAECYHCLGCAYSEKGDSGKAREFFEKMLENYLSAYGEEHPDVGNAYCCLGNIWGDLMDIEKALQFYEKAMRINYMTRPNHPKTANSYINAGLKFCEMNKRHKGIEYLEKGINIMIGLYGENNKKLFLPFYCLEQTYRMIGDVVNADLYKEKLERLEKQISLRQPSSKINSSYSSIMVK
eukprot:TRINITY_DN14672_c0_g1_i1.p1 TRINITY_DN14672_c0_g1~~TRINITY_DN14672_c0_g1_i1.p1  ORF type:complete len:506 (-),score=87.21 TRINITY_DN14672_c0_g1_i1:151-1668(-)